MPTKGQYTDADLASSPTDAAGFPHTQGTPQPDRFAGLKEFGSDVGDFALGAGKGLMSTATAPAAFAAKHLQGKIAGINPSRIAERETAITPTNTAQSLGKGAEQAGEFMLPGGAEEKLASLAPKALKPVAKLGASALGSGTVNALQGGSFGTGAALGAGGSAVGQGIKAAAPAIAEGALKVRGNQRLFGRTVGDAILNDTSGVRPETIGKSAGATMARLSPQLDAADQASASAGKTGTLMPARAAVDKTIAGHQGNRAMQTAASIQPVSDFLRRDQLTQLPLAASQPAPALRALKRGLNEDFIHNWSLDKPPAQRGAARQAYGNINEQLHSISPETKDIDQRISSLVPVKLQGERVASGAPLLQRVGNRVMAHTGAATMGALGAVEGRREGGTPGMIAGGLTGLVAPELAASPEGQMILARTLNKARALKPAVGAAAQFGRKKEE
jgi:hypothetical protein